MSRYSRTMALDRLAMAHGHPGNLLRSVVHRDNPAWRIIGGEPGPLIGGDPASFQQMAVNIRQVTAWWSRRVAIVEVNVNGAPVAIGTAFHLPGMGPRMLTARHLLPGICPNARLIYDYPFAAYDRLNQPTGPGQVRLRFTENANDPADGEICGLTKVLWCHRDLDVMILELDRVPHCQGDGSAPVGLGMIGNPIAVPGFPLERNPARFRDDQGLLPEVFRDADLGFLHLSIGTCHPLHPSHVMVWHDAPTLKGYSGAPVIDLATGRLVGLHVQGVDPRQTRGRNALLRFDPVLATPAFLDVMQGGQGAKKRERVALTMAPGHEAMARIGMMAGWSRSALADEPFLNAIREDQPDFRDLPYRPALLAPRSGIAPQGDVPVLDQGDRPACAGYALAAVIAAQAPGRAPVSPVMLNALARQHDGVVDQLGDGTTLRGVLKGFYHNGVCAAQDGDSPDPSGLSGDWLLTRRIAAEARKCVLGAYYRIDRRVTDMQMAIQETGAVLVAARIHRGWFQPMKGVILHGVPDMEHVGAHAFAVTGYNEDGFIVQNSWGKAWGGGDLPAGHALWSYEDWAESVIDAWALRLAPEAPKAFGLLVPTPADPMPKPRRIHLLGHLAMVEADGMIGSGATGTTLGSLRETGAYLSSGEAAGKYDTVALVFHDPFGEADQTVRLAAQLTARFKARRIYPLHVLYGFDEIATCALRVTSDATRLNEAFRDSDHPTETYLERMTAPLIRRSHDSFARGLRESLAHGPLWEALVALISELPDRMQVLTLGCGLGCVTEARAIRAAAGEIFLAPLKRARRFWMAPVIRRPPKMTVLRLDPQRREGAIPGYHGDWPDLVAAALDAGGTPRAGRQGAQTLSSSSLRQALADTGLVNRLGAPSVAAT